MGLIDAHKALAGKFAVVIGGSGGIGKTVTLALAGAGIHIATCDKDADDTRTIVDEVKALGPRVMSRQVDVADVDALDRFYDEVEREFGQIDIVVNVAGGGMKREAFAESTRAQNARDIRINYGYVLDSLHRAIPLIRKGGRGGSVINFTTIEASRGAATFAVYAGAKAAIANFSRALAVELAAEGIRVNCLAPDTTDAKSRFKSLTPERAAEFHALGPDPLAPGFEMYIPQKTPPTQNDLANGVLFLASDLSRAITGTTLHVDGGTIASMGFINWPFGDGFGPTPKVRTLRRLFFGDKA